MRTGTFLFRSVGWNWNRQYGWSTESIGVNPAPALVPGSNTGVTSPVPELNVVSPRHPWLTIWVSVLLLSSWNKLTLTPQYTGMLSAPAAEFAKTSNPNLFTLHGSRKGVWLVLKFKPAMPGACT